VPTVVYLPGMGCSLTADIHVTALKSPQIQSGLGHPLVVLAFSRFCTEMLLWKCGYRLSSAALSTATAFAVCRDVRVSLHQQRARGRLDLRWNERNVITTLHSHSPYRFTRNIYRISTSYEPATVLNLAAHLANPPARHNHTTTSSGPPQTKPTEYQ